MPNTEVRFVGKEIGPVLTEGDALLMGVTHTLAETLSPDIVLVPGGSTTPGQMVDDVLNWLPKGARNHNLDRVGLFGGINFRRCRNSEGSAGNDTLSKMGVLKIIGAKPQPHERIVQSGKVVTCAGVSAGIDLGLWLAGKIVGREQLRTKCWTSACRAPSVVSSPRLPGGDSSIGISHDILTIHVPKERATIRKADLCPGE